MRPAQKRGDRGSRTSEVVSLLTSWARPSASPLAPAEDALLHASDRRPKGRSLAVGSRNRFSAVDKCPVVLNRCASGRACDERKAGSLAANQNANLFLSLFRQLVQFSNRARRPVDHEVMVVTWILIDIRCIEDEILHSVGDRVS